jgi:hypothetical protein
MKGMLATKATAAPMGSANRFAFVTNELVDAGMTYLVLVLKLITRVEEPAIRR